jgi:hypothetical protein
VAARAARALSPRVPRDATWEDLLRDGIRGATAGEVVRVLAAAGYDRPRVLEPTRMGCRDAIDIWYGYSTARRPLAVKRVMRAAFKGLSRLSPEPVVPELNLALQRP